MEPVDIARLLAVAGLVVGAVAYLLLIRRRRAGRDADEVRRRDESQQRGMARFRHLRRHDDE